MKTGGSEANAIRTLEMASEPPLLEMMMLVTRKSMVSGKTRTLDLPISEDEVIMWQDGAKVQDAFPNLSPSQREFILTGITDDEWDETFPEEEELEDEPAF